MTYAESQLTELQDMPAITVSAAIYLAVGGNRLEKWHEYTDSKRVFLYSLFDYYDGSWLKIHRNGAVRAYSNMGDLIKKLNVYTHKEPIK